MIKSFIKAVQLLSYKFVNYSLSVNKGLYLIYNIN
jgi:hypothetical protein